MPTAEIDSNDLRLLALLKAGLRQEPPATELFGDINDNEWMEIFKLSRNNNIEALCADGVEQLPEQYRPPRKVWIPWITERQKVEASFHHKQEVQSQLIQFFKKHHINTLVLKGTSLSKRYPHPSHRQFSDLDFYHFGQWEQADRLLEKHLGITASHDSYHHTQYTFCNVTVENHYTFVNSRNQKSNTRYETLLQSLVPSATFDLLFLIRHMSGHFASSRITLRDLCDWTLFLENNHNDIDWDLVTKALQEYNIHPFVAILQYLTEHYLGNTPHPSLPPTDDKQLSLRVLNDIIHGEFDELEHPTENVGRIFWKISRYRANRWKHQLCYSDPWLSTFFRGVFVHMLKPKTIIHKM